MFSSCSQNDEKTPTEADAKNEAKLILNLSENDKQYEIEGFSGKTCFISYNNTSDNETPSPSYFASLNIDSKETSDIGKGGKLFFSSVSNVILNDRYFYKCSATDEGEVLLCADAQEKTTKVIAKRPDMMTVTSQLAKLNEDEFIWLISYRNEDSGEIKTVIEKYNCKTDNFTELVTGTYLNKREAEGSEGILYEAISACDAKVYALGRQRIGDEYEFSLYIMDAEGKLLKTIKSETFQTHLREAPISRFYVIGNYMIIKQSQSAGNIIMKLNEDKVEMVDGLLGETLIDMFGLENFYDSSKTPYIYFQHFNEKMADADSLNSIVTRLNIKNGDISKIDIKPNSDYPNLIIPFIDENGSIIGLFGKKGQNLTEIESDSRAYYFSAETLNSLATIN